MDSGTFDNKYLFHLFAIDKGFTEFMPQIYLAQIGEQLTVHHPIEYPCIIKPTVGRGGVGIKIINSADELTELDQDYLIEEYIKGEDEYVTHYEVQQGKIIWAITFTRAYPEMNIKKGSIADFKVIKVKKEPFDRIFRAMNYTGFACANYKKTPCIKIFEINPRIGGSLVKYINDYWV